MALRRRDRLRYKAQHHGMAATFALGVRLWHLALDRQFVPPAGAEIATWRRRFQALLDEDLANAEAGVYPHSLLFRFPTRRFLRDLPGGVVGQWPRILRRKAQNDYQDLPDVPDIERYPAYYRRNFHWQTDGWFSATSARYYDSGVEFLFLGTADVMRRIAIAPVIAATQHLQEARICDLACGTGRSLAQLAAALPRAQLYGVDLSEWYLREAERTLGPGHGVSLVAENVEETTFQDGTFDAVSSVFLFHELPGDVRRRVMREAWRLLKPGGTFVVCDSAQLIDSPELTEHLVGFPRLYHEPYFKGYLKDDLAALMRECGFTDVQARTHLVSRVVAARKP